MKMYYAKSVDGKRTLQFRGETLVCNQPFLFEHLVKIHNKNVSKSISMKEYQIIEIEMEMKDEGKRHQGDDASHHIQ